MPELPEVEITRQRLKTLLKGRRIVGFSTDWPRGLKMTTPAKLRSDIKGRRILDVERRGKVIFFQLSGKPPRSLAMHLRMSGRLEIAPSRKTKDLWTRFAWKLDKSRELRFIDPRKFGVVWYGSDGDFSRDPYLGRLGRDPRAVSGKDFLRIFQSARGMAKPFILRQDVFSGIGNIIADEALWKARVHPQKSIPDMSASQIALLRRAILKTIRDILASGGTTLRNWGGPDGMTGSYQRRRMVHGRAGKPCPRCAAILRRIVVGGRGTTICPHCQRI